MRQTLEPIASNEATIDATNRVPCVIAEAHINHALN